MKLFALALLLLAATPLPSSAAGAATSAEVPISAEEVAAKRVKAGKLGALAKDLRKTAEAQHQRDGIECRKTVLVNNCLSRARDRQLEKIEEARGLEIEVGALEREIRQFEVAERRNQRARRLEERQLPATVSVEGAKATTLQPATGTEAPASASTPPATPAEKAK